MLTLFPLFLIITNNFTSLTNQTIRNIKVKEIHKNTYLFITIQQAKRRRKKKPALTKSHSSYLAANKLKWLRKNILSKQCFAFCLERLFFGASRFKIQKSKGKENKIIIIKKMRFFGEKFSQEKKNPQKSNQNYDNLSLYSLVDLRLVFHLPPPPLHLSLSHSLSFVLLFWNNFYKNNNKKKRYIFKPKKKNPKKDNQHQTTKNTNKKKSIFIIIQDLYFCNKTQNKKKKQQKKPFINLYH